jgi:hypothetical protein
MDLDNLYTPKDRLTIRYAEATERFETLPVSLNLENDYNPDSQGTPNLEFKKHLSNLRNMYRNTPNY